MAGDDGHSHGVDDLGDEGERADLAGVAAGLGALGGDDVSAGLDGLEGVADAAAHHHHDHVALVHLGDELGGDGEPGDEDVHVLLEDDAHVGADHLRVGREEVDGERLVGEVTGLADLFSQRGRVEGGGADDAEPAGVGDGGDEPGHGDAAHTGEEDRVVDAELIAEWCVKGVVHGDSFA